MGGEDRSEKGTEPEERKLRLGIWASKSVSLLRAGVREKGVLGTQ